MRLGVERLWCPETINEVIGIDDRHVSVRGYKTEFVWDHRDGQVVTGIDARSITHGDPAQVRADIGTRYHSKVSADGRWVAAASYGPRVRIFDNHTGAMKFGDDPEDAYESLTFSHDGTRIVGTAEHAFVWTIGESTPRRVPSCIRGAQLDADGSIVGGAFEGMVGRWSLDNTELARVSVRRKINSLSFTADGRYGAVTTYGTGGLCMWPMPDIVIADLARGRAILRFHDGVEDVTRVATISRNSRWLALSDEAGIRVMPATPLPTWITPPVIARWPAHHSLEFGDGDRAVISGDGVAKLVALPTGEVLASKRLTPETGPRWSPDGRCVVGLERTERVVRIRSARDLEVIGEIAFEHSIGAFAVAPDGERIAVSDGATIVIATLPSRSR